MIKTMRIFLVFLMLSLSSFDGSAQYPLAAGAPSGIYIFMDNHIPKDGYFEVFRSPAGKNSFKSIGKISAPASEDELTGRIRKYEPAFADLGHYTRAGIDYMWNYLQKNTVMDTLRPVNYPVMLLAAGTAFYDDQAEKNTSYKYKVEYYENNSQKYSKTTSAASYPGKFDIKAPVFHSEKATHHNIYTDWYITSDPYLYTFNVYRRQNMAGEFEKVNVVKGFYNRGDSLFLVVNDTTVNPRMVYEYYVVPLDRLGNTGGNSPRSTTTSFQNDDVPIIRRLNVTTGKEDHSVVVTWKFNHQDMIRSISIYRSDNFDSGYVKVAEVPALDTTYTDRVTGAMENYYYYLVLQGIMNRSFPSAKVGGHSMNRTVPQPPSDVGAEPVKGGVKIYWTHLDPNVTGYFIYRDMGLNDSLQQISRLIKPDREIMSYTDTSAALNGNHSYTYAVRSVNDSYLMSMFSEKVSAQPDIASVVASPSNLRGGFTGGKILLVWDNMNSTDENLLGYNVYRRVSGTGNYTKINPEMLLFNSNTYTDSSLVSGTSYDYSVTALDESGSESPKSKTYSVRIPTAGSMTDAPTGFRVSHGNGSAVLTWTRVEDDNLGQYAIYRYLPGNKPQLLTKVQPDSFTYEDKTVKKGTLYFYYMTAISKSGRESVPCQTISIRF